MELLSDKNTLLKQIRRAVSRGGLLEDAGKYSGYAVAEGAHLVEEARAAGREIAAIFVTESALAQRDYAGARLISDKIFRELSSTEAPQGILALVKPPVWTLGQVITKNALLVVLDGIQDPGNAGAIVRAAEAFGATGAVFVKGTVNPYNPKCLRAAAGSMFRLPMVAGVEENGMLEAFASHSCRVFAAMPHAKKLLSETSFEAPCAIVIGSEGGGVGQTLANRATGFRIATVGVESLNAAVAAGVILYEASRQRASSGSESKER